MNTQESKLLEDVKAYISRNPSGIPAFLDAIRDGMDAWKKEVETHLESSAYLGMTAAMQLPKNMKHWNHENRTHATCARLIAVGLGLNRRKGASGIELDLVDFVRKADEHALEDALRHYETLGHPRV